MFLGNSPIKKTKTHEKKTASEGEDSEKAEDNGASNSSAGNPEKPPSPALSLSPTNDHGLEELERRNYAQVGGNVKPRAGGSAELLP